MLESSVSNHKLEAAQRRICDAAVTAFSSAFNDCRTRFDARRDEVLSANTFSIFPAALLEDWQRFAEAAARSSGRCDCAFRTASSRLSGV